MLGTIPSKIWKSCQHLKDYICIYLLEGGGSGSRAVQSVSESVYPFFFLFPSFKKMLTVSRGNKTAESRTLSLLILGDFLKGQWVCTRAFSYATAAQYCSGLSHPISGGCWFPFGNVQNVPCTHVYVLSLYCWLTVCRRFGARTVSKHIQAPIVMRPWAGLGPSGSAARKITSVIKGFQRGEVMQQEIRQLSEPVAMELEENYILEVERKKKHRTFREECSPANEAQQPRSSLPR